MLVDAPHPDPCGNSERTVGRSRCRSSTPCATIRRTSENSIRIPEFARCAGTAPHTQGNPGGNRTPTIENRSDSVHRHLDLDCQLGCNHQNCVEHCRATARQDGWLCLYTNAFPVRQLGALAAAKIVRGLLAGCVDVSDSDLGAFPLATKFRTLDPCVAPRTISLGLLPPTNRIGSIHPPIRVTLPPWTDGSAHH